MTKNSAQRKTYQVPRVVYDAQLEAQAGSPLGNFTDGIDLTGTGQ